MVNPTPGTTGFFGFASTDSAESDTSDAMVIETAHGYFSGSSVANASTPLVGESTSVNDFYDDLEQAAALLKAGEKEEARELYAATYAVFSYTAVLGKDMVLPATFAIELASTYDNDSEDRAKWTSIAKTEADHVYNKRTQWDFFNSGMKKEAYQALIDCYKEIMSLIPTARFPKYPENNSASVKEICSKLTVLRQVTNPVPDLSADDSNPLKAEEFLRRRVRREKGPSKLSIIFAFALISLTAIVAGVIKSST